MQTFGTRWLARVLGVSLARARKLLSEGRIKGARKHRGTGEWLIPDGRYMLERGKRGPQLGTLQRAVGAIPERKRVGYRFESGRNGGRWVEVWE